MTGNEYGRIREMIEQRFRQDMAALERVWFTIHGANPPDSPVSLGKPADTGEPEIGGGGGKPLVSAADLGILSGKQMEQMHRKYRLSPEAAARKKAYMKAYWEKRKAKKGK
jgi:hypothetical protein